MKRTTFKQLLKKYRDGTATPAERYVVDRWYESLDRGGEKHPSMAEVDEKAMIRSRIWQGVHDRRQRTKWHRHPGVRVAASMALVVSISTLLYWIAQTTTPSAHHPSKPGHAPHTITTSGRQLKQVRLPDSTIVWLNAHSALEVPAAFGDRERRIKLSGEAFFEVKRDTLRPFLVATDGVVVEVLGTSFSIQSYERLQNVNVAVTTGKVLVKSASTPRLSELTMGQSLVYQKATGDYRVDKAMVAERPSWIKGRAELKMASFDELAQTLANLYDVQLTTDDDQVMSYRYNLTLESTLRLEDAMELICTIVGKTYKKEGEGIVEIF